MPWDLRLGCIFDELEPPESGRPRITTETSEIAAFVRQLPVPRRESRAAPRPRRGSFTPPRIRGPQASRVGISTARRHEATSAEAAVASAEGEVGSPETGSPFGEGEPRLVSRGNRPAHVPPHAPFGLC